MGWHRPNRPPKVDDPRHLWPHVVRIIGEVEPPFVFLENVAHHLRLGFPEVASGLVGMADVDAGQVDQIVVYKIDRLT